VKPHESENKTFSQSLYVLLAEGFLSRLSFGILSFALPIYAYRKLGLSLTETGFLFSLNLIVEQLLKPLMGWAADRCGLKLSFTAAVSLRSLVALLLVFAGSPWQVYAIRLLHGFSESLRDPSVNALIAEHSGGRKIASAFAWYNTAKQVAGAIGKGASGILLTLTADNYSKVFLVSFALSVLPLFVIVRYLKEPQRSSPENYGDKKRGTLQNADPEGAESGSRQPAVFAFAMLGFLIAAAAHMMHQLFPILAVEYGGLNTAQTGIIYSLSTLVILFSGPLFGWLSDHVSRRLVLTIRGVANTVSSLVYWLFPSFVGMAAGQVIDNAGKAAFRPAWGSLMAYVSGFDRRNRARTMSWLSVGEGMGEMLGPMLGGFLWSTWGIAVLMMTRIALALVSEIYALWLTSTVEKSQPHPLTEPIISASPEQAQR
jgi:MFS family permease